MRVFFLFLILNVSAFAQDKYYLDFKILSNFFNKIQINKTEINWSEEYFEYNGYGRIDITDKINNTDKSFSILIDSESVADIGNNFGYWIKIYKNNNIIFQYDRITKTIEKNQTYTSEFSIDK
jgi:hypothetical protein